MLGSGHFIIRLIRVIRVLLVAALCKSGKAERKKTREPTPVSPLPSYILHLTSLRSSLQLTASRTAALVATLASATLGDVLSGSCLRVKLHPTHLVGELAAELGGYRATQSAPSVGCVQHLGGCHV